MCGIVACLQPPLLADSLHDQVRTMLASVAHRGPDDWGSWTSPDGRLGLGHHRLAIQDVSSAGHQPMQSPSGEWCLVYNGEIYNAESIRAQLPGSVRWHGHSDTEVLLAGFDQWGLRETIVRAAGMFAMAVWQRSRNRFFLIRDRLGIKPLYYSVQGQRVFCGSELKSLMAHPEFQASIDPSSVSLFLQYGYVPGSHAILSRTHKLAPGTILEFDAQDPSVSQHHVYWSAANVASAGRETPWQGSHEDVVEATNDLLAHVVREHQISDVPTGAFLSGGVDSSLVTALMKASNGSPPKTFCIGFDDAQFDEAPVAREIARHLGTDHHEHYVRTDDVLDFVPRLASFYCEPLSDTSTLPCLLISAIARRDVTVVLTGDGGDELFAGYRRYSQTLEIARRLQSVPNGLRRLASRLLDNIPRSLLESATPLQRVFRGRRGDGFSESTRKLSQLLASCEAEQLYQTITSISFNANANGLVRLHGDAAHEAAVRWRGDWDTNVSLLDNMQQWDSHGYLPNDILHKVDIASMAFGLEVRVPLLDHRVFEWSWSLPQEWKLHQGFSKRILRQTLQQYVPPHLMDRPKRGFSAPMDNWLRGPLRDWAECLLCPETLPADGWLNRRRVMRYWKDLISGRAGHARIWPILVFQAWKRHYFESITRPKTPMPPRRRKTSLAVPA